MAVDAPSAAPRVCARADAANEAAAKKNDSAPNCTASCNGTQADASDRSEESRDPISAPATAQASTEVCAMSQPTRRAPRTAVRDTGAVYSISARPLSTSAAMAPTPLETATVIDSNRNNGWEKLNPM